MSKKKQNRVVAGQNKARENAKRKSKGSGSAPLLSLSQMSNSSEIDTDLSSTVTEEFEPQSKQIQTEANSAASQDVDRTAPLRSFRPSQGNLTLLQSNLRSEVLRIGIITTLVVVILTSIKLVSF